MGSVLTGLLRRFLSALGTDPVDHQLHFNHGIVGWQWGGRYTTFGQAKYLAASDTMEMWVLAGRFITVCGPSFGESPGRSPSLSHGNHGADIGVKAFL
jgi:hypothetical protein